MTIKEGENGNGRTHEPSLRELTAELDGIREIIDERDRLYKERDEARKTAVDAALSAAKEAVSAALAAADRAVIKVETANEKRFEAVNEFRGQLADQATTFMPRSEANIRFDGLAEKVDSLRSSRSEGVGEKASLGMMLAIGAQVLSSIGVVIAILFLFARKAP